MIWIVQVALRRPYTFVVLALLILIFWRAVGRCCTPTGYLPEYRYPGHQRCVDL